MAKKKIPEKDMIGLRGISFLVMFVKIKEVHPRERNLKGEKNE